MLTMVSMPCTSASTILHESLFPFLTSFVIKITVVSATNF